VLSHHHPDHTVNVGLFPGARVHDFQAIHVDDRWIDRPAEGFELSPNVTLIETPGHTPQDITTLVSTESGLVRFTHLWWAADGPADDPADDPYTHDAEALQTNRARVRELVSEIVPGHGPRFVPDESTPR
jgi:glyoxylase-like metal-dependent hydrolase (beta-lactamase superfamily II)